MTTTTNTTIPKLHRLNPGNYVTDRDEAIGSYVAYRYTDPATDRPDGWMVCRWELTERGHRDLVSVEWCSTLANARAEIGMRLSWDEVTA